MMPCKPVGLAFAGLCLAALPVSAQQRAERPDSAPAQLRTTLRAFYYGLAHRDWEVMSSRILPAKVVAHRPPPEDVVAASTRQLPPGVSHRAAACAPTSTAVDRASILFDGDWAEASVPRCAGGPGGGDRFRLIRVDGRWWIVYLRLAGDAAPLELAR